MALTLRPSRKKWSSMTYFHFSQAPGTSQMTLTWCTSPRVPKWDICRTTCHLSCSIDHFQETSYFQITLVGDLCHKHRIPLYFWCQIGSCYVNALDMSKREMKMLQFGKCHVILSHLPFMASKCVLN